MKITPIGDRVAITPDPVSNKSSSGFIIPASSLDKPKSGVIIAVGESPLITLKEGDNVLYSKITGTEIVVGGKTVIIMRQADLLCKIEE